MKWVQTATKSWDTHRRWKDAVWSRHTEKRNKQLKNGGLHAELLLKNKPDIPIHEKGNKVEYNDYRWLLVISTARHRNRM